jgi:hypothetical protein
MLNAIISIRLLSKDMGLEKAKETRGWEKVVIAKYKDREG